MAKAKRKGFVQWLKELVPPLKEPRPRGIVPKAARPYKASPFEEGRFDGFKGRANRYASKEFLEQTAWKAASKAARSKAIREGYTPTDHGFVQDPYGNAAMIRLQLAAPGTPEEYKRGYKVGTAER